MLLRCPSANDISRSIVSGARSPMETTYSVGAYDIGETAQCARVLNDGVVVHCRKGSIRAAEIVFFKRIVARQPADDVGQRGPADVGNDLLKKHPAVSPDTSSYVEARAEEHGLDEEYVAEAIRPVKAVQDGNRARYSLSAF